MLYVEGRTQTDLRLVAAGLELAVAVSPAAKTKWAVADFQDPMTARGRGGMTTEGSVRRRRHYRPEMSLITARPRPRPSLKTRVSCQRSEGHKSGKGQGSGSAWPRAQTLFVFVSIEARLDK